MTGGGSEQSTTMGSSNDDEECRVEEGASSTTSSLAATMLDTERPGCPTSPGCGCVGPDPDITISITPTTGGQFELTVDRNETIENLKKIISKRLKVAKERICLLHRDRQLREGTLEENRLQDGSRLTLLPSVETGLLAQRPEQSVMQALESLSDSQVNDFLSGKAPLNLTMRLGDHMMLIQLQLSTVTPASPPTRSSSPTTSTGSSSSNTSPVIITSPRKTSLFGSRTNSSSSSAASKCNGNSTRTSTSPAAGCSASLLTAGTTTASTSSSSSSSSCLERPSASCGSSHSPHCPQQSRLSNTSKQVNTTRQSCPGYHHHHHHHSHHHHHHHHYHHHHSRKSNTSTTDTTLVQQKPTASAIETSQVNHVCTEAPVSSKEEIRENKEIMTTTNATTVVGPPKKRLCTTHSHVPGGASAARNGVESGVSSQITQTSSIVGSVDTAKSTSATLDTRALAEASRNLTQKLKQLSSEDSAKRRQGAIIESMHHHGKGVYSGTFSGTLNPALQDRHGRPKRDISTIIHILNDLLCATPASTTVHYKTHHRHAITRQQSLTTSTPMTPTSPTPPNSNTTSPATDNSEYANPDYNSEELSKENEATKGKMKRLRLVMEQRRAKRRARRQASAAPYTTQWAAMRPNSSPTHDQDSSSTSSGNPVTSDSTGQQPEPELQSCSSEPVVA